MRQVRWLVRLAAAALAAVWSAVAAGTAHPLASTGSWEAGPSRPAVAADVQAATPAPGDQRDQRALIRALEGRHSPLEERLFADTDDGRLDEHSVLRAALIAGGVDDPETLAACEARFAQLADAMMRSAGVTGPPRERAEAIFAFLHEQILVGGYDLDASDLSVVLQTGRFNCVTATILFDCLATRVGLDTQAVQIPAHAMSRVILDGGGWLDVETTCPRWFELMHDPKRRAEMLAKTLGRPEDGTSHEPRELTDCQLVAMLYYNRGVDLLAKGRYAEALAANAKALRLDPASATARGNLLATLNNWAIALSTQDRFADAIARLRQGEAIGPDYEPFGVNFVHVYYRWAERLAAAGRSDEALAVLDEAERKTPATYFRRMREEILRRRVGPHIPFENARAATSPAGAAASPAFN